jgi:hypothetical protein
MAIGDRDDILNRLLAVIPPWFGDSNTREIILGLLTGYAELGSEIYNQYLYAKDQTRIRTATDMFLDLFSQDYFGVMLPRGDGESDTQYRQRILDNLLREKATRRGMNNAIINITGRTPRIIEPRRPYDCGGYSTACAGYSVGGAYGSVLTPYQAFIDVYRPNLSTVPGVTGYNDTVGGYGHGYIAYSGLDQLNNQVFDNAILQTINDTKVYGTKVWVRLNN